MLWVGLGVLAAAVGIDFLRETREEIHATSQAVLEASAEAIRASRAAMEASEAAIRAGRVVEDSVPGFLKPDRRTARARFGGQPSLEHQLYDELSGLLWTTLGRERGVLMEAQRIADRAVKRGHAARADLDAIRALKSR